MVDKRIIRLLTQTITYYNAAHFNRDFM